MKVSNAIGEVITLNTHNPLFRCIDMNEPPTTWQPEQCWHVKLRPVLWTRGGLIATLQHRSDSLLRQREDGKNECRCHPRLWSLWSFSMQLYRINQIPGCGVKDTFLLAMQRCKRSSLCTRASQCEPWRPELCSDHAKEDTVMKPSPSGQLKTNFGKAGGRRRVVFAAFEQEKPRR